MWLTILLTIKLRVTVKVQTRSEKRVAFKLAVHSQKAQGIYNNTSNSLTGAGASSAGAIHYASALPPSNPMPMARPRAHGTMKVGRKSKYAPVVFKAHLRSIALGRTKGTYKHKGHKKSHKKHIRHHKHNCKAGTIMHKKTAYCTRSYR